MWGVEVNGKRVLVSNSQLYSLHDFNRACMAQANVIPVTMPPVKWLEYLGAVIQNADVITMPAEAGPTGQFWEWVNSFLTQRASALAKEEVTLGKVFREKGRVYFRGHDLFRFLDSRKVKYQSQQWVWTQLREHDGETVFWKLRGNTGINVWSLPNPESFVTDEPEPGQRLIPEQTESF